MKERSLILLPGLALVFTPELAAACATCLSGSETARQAYYATTALLAVLPLGLLATLLWWLRRSAPSEREELDSESD